MATYRANHLDFAKLMVSHQVRALIHDRAEETAALLHQWATEHMHSGEYARSISVHTGLDIRVRDRVAAFITVSTAYATALEVGSHNIRNPPRPMTRLLDQIRG